MKTLTAVDLYNYVHCPHRVYLDANGDPREKSEVSSFVQLLWEKGLQTEREYVERLGADSVEDLQGLPKDVAWETTLRLMEEGATLIYQGYLIHENRLGQPDLLLRRDDAPSRFGPYHYEPVDIKAGRGWEERNGEKTKFKKHYAYQVLFYHDLLTDIQGTAPRQARIINVEGEFEEFARSDFAAEFLLASDEVTRLVNARETSEPVLGSQCHQCEWLKRCHRWVEEKSDPSGLFFVGRQKFGLKEVGLKTIDDIARMNVADHLEPPGKVRGLGEKSLVRMKRRAQVMLAAKPQIRPGYAFPDVRTEIYFDIEDDPTQDVTYLFGCWIREAGAPERFLYFLAERPEDEAQTCRRFWDFITGQSDCVYYVYSAKERSSLNRLARKHDLSEEILERYKTLEYDLYRDLIVAYSDWPTYSYGIKQIAKLTGFAWRDADPSGANSIAWYNDYLEQDGPLSRELMERILIYNEDDCRAMMHIKDWFVAQNP